MDNDCNSSFVWYYSPLTARTWRMHMLLQASQEPYPHIQDRAMQALEAA